MFFKLLILINFDGFLFDEHCEPHWWHFADNYRRRRYSRERASQSLEVIQSIFSLASLAGRGGGFRSVGERQGYLMKFECLQDTKTSGDYLGCPAKFRENLAGQ